MNPYLDSQEAADVSLSRNMSLGFWRGLQPAMLK